MACDLLRGGESVLAPKVSVVVTCFNREMYISEAIDSALAQTFADIEVLVVDDGSVDGSAQICQSYGDRLRYIYQPNQGASAAKNTGVAAARGEYIAFLDSDDRWEPHKLQMQMRHLADHPAVDVVYAYAMQFLSPELAPEIRAGLHCPGGAMPAPTSGTLLAKKATFARVGDYRTDLLVGIDVEWYSRSQGIGLSSFILPEVLLHRRIHPTNSGITQKSERIQHLSILKQHIDRQRARGKESAS